MLSLKQEANITKETEITFVEINQTIALNHFIIYGLYESTGDPTGLYFIDACNMNTNITVTWLHVDKQNIFPTNLINKFDFVFEHVFKNSKVYSFVVVDYEDDFSKTIYSKINELLPRGTITEPIVGIDYILNEPSISLAIQTVCCSKKSNMVARARDAFIIEFDAHLYRCSISPLFKDTTIKIYSFDSGQTIHVPLKYPWYKLEEKLISIW